MRFVDRPRERAAAIPPNDTRRHCQIVRCRPQGKVVVMVMEVVDPSRPREWRVVNLLQRTRCVSTTVALSILTICGSGPRLLVAIRKFQSQAVGTLVQWRHDFRQVRSS
jgi:hypothetical protein